MPWPLGPPDGRYLVRRARDALGGPDHARGGLHHLGADPDPTHVLVFATLGAQQRGRIDRRRRSRPALPEPEPEPVTTGRATIISVEKPFADERVEDARRWLASTGREHLIDDLGVLNAALRAYRVVTGDPGLAPITLSQLLVARVGFGSGEEVADGRWAQASELSVAGGQEESRGRGRRRRTLEPQARLADILRQRTPILICEDLTLRARHDLDQGLNREAALQLSIALDAALAELPRVAAALVVEAGGPTDLRPRIAELEDKRDAITRIAAEALHREPIAPDLEAVRFTLERLEAALRARNVAEQHRNG